MYPCGSRKGRQGTAFSKRLPPKVLGRGHLLDSVLPPVSVHAAAGGGEPGRGSGQRPHSQVGSLERSQLPHMQVPRLGVESELQLPAYTTAIARLSPSHVCDLHRSSGQLWILNPPSEARDQLCILMTTSCVLNLLSHSGNSGGANWCPIPLCLTSLRVGTAVASVGQQVPRPGRLGSEPGLAERPADERRLSLQQVRESLVSAVGSYPCLCQCVQPLRLLGPCWPGQLSQARGDSLVVAKVRGGRHPSSRRRRKQEGLWVLVLHLTCQEPTLPVPPLPTTRRTPPPALLDPETGPCCGPKCFVALCPLEMLRFLAHLQQG